MGACARRMLEERFSRQGALARWAQLIDGLTEPGLPARPVHVAIGPLTPCIHPLQDHRLVHRSEQCSLLVVVLGVAVSLVRPVFWARALAATGLAALLLAGISPLGAWLIRPLEDRFPVWRDDGREVAGIVVLGGTVNARVSFARDQLTLGEGERIVAAADLARRFPAARIVFSGGSGDVRESPPKPTRFSISPVSWALMYAG